MSVYTIGNLTVHDFTVAARGPFVFSDGDITVHDYGRGYEEYGVIRDGHVFHVENAPLPPNWRELVAADVEYQLSKPLTEADYL